MKKSILGELYNSGIRLVVLSVLLIFICSADIVYAKDPTGIKLFLRNSTTGQCASLETEVPVKIYYITRSTHSGPWNIGSPVFVYIKNHGEERTGTEPDSSILMDYIKEHYIVITIDFENNPRAVSPHFDKDLHALFKAICADGEKDGFGRKYKEIFARIEELDVNHVSMLMEGLGHELPYDTNEKLGNSTMRLYLINIKDLNL